MKNEKPKIYTVATAHLDTSWLWTLEQTIQEYLPDTLKRNFELLEKYPEYKFNFEGSYRYELIKEYYPDDYKKIINYIKDKRWNPCGACYENGDVNIPSPEALIRNILYGNGFFRNEFGVSSNDIFLPDCFGFGRALPTVAAHCGLTGFSTGKLFWGSSVPIPFDTGRWTGPDGNGIWAALMPFSYTTAFGDMSKTKRVLEKLENNKKKNLPVFTMAYHGIGDRGGSPHKSSVKNVINAQRNNESAQTEVYSATTKEFFDMLEDLPESQKQEMPVSDSEFLLTAHGAGSYTSRTVTKRWNRRCELLADAAERFATAAYAAGLADYPQYGLDSAWKSVIAHHFHDDITGTSFEECYKRNHNDYIRALNTFSSEYTAACKKLSSQLDTTFVKGIPVVVSNPVQTVSSRKEAVSVTIESNADFFAVFDKNGNNVPSQTKILTNNKRRITFIADVLSCGLSVYDIQETSENICNATQLKITDDCIENKYLTVRLDQNGDICSIFDKRLDAELLKSPVRLSILNNTHSFDWPAWEIRYEDCNEKPFMYASKPEIRIKDCGDALCSFEIIKTAGKSTFRQIISLDCESEFVTVYNETDWCEEAALLKAEFSVTAENDEACYDIGIGFTKRKTNTKNLYEVPAQKWASVTDKNNDFGVSIFSDSRTGWDKPDNSTLRLTLIHTPMANYRWECSQHVMDMGINRYSFGIMGYNSSTGCISAYADTFCQPMHTFITTKHAGNVNTDYSFAKLNNDNIRITAIKKAAESEKVIFRVAECSGADINGVCAEFSLPVCDIYEVRGDETEIKKIPLKDGKLYFDIKHNEIRSFAIEFKNCKSEKSHGDIISLPFNATGITTDNNRNKSTLCKGISIPREITPEKLLFAGTEFEFSDAENNCLVCDGSKIRIGEGYNSVHLLVTSLDGDKNVKFGSTDVHIPDCAQHLGHWDLMQLHETAYIKPIPQAITLTHTHAPEANIIAKQFYIFDIEIPLDSGNEITLPYDKNIVIFAATAVKDNCKFKNGDEHFDKAEKRNFDYTFSDYAIKRMNPNKLERILNKLFDRTFTISVKAGEFYNKYALNELYYIIRNISNKMSYKKNVEKLISTRKNPK